MARDGSTPLRTFVRRTLTLRLCAVTLVAALAVLAFTYLRQREMFELQVTDVVRIELALLMHRASQISLGRGMTVAESLPFALDERREVSNQRASGHFVYLRIFSPALARPLEATEADYPLLSAARRALQSSPPHAPVEQVRSEMRNVDGMPYVHVLAPIRDLAGQGAGQAELVFAVSSEAIGAARVAVLKAIA